MARNLERRIEALEARSAACKPRIAVIHQSKDGSWPDEPDAELVIGIRRMGIMKPDDSEHERAERNPPGTYVVSQRTHFESGVSRMPGSGAMTDVPLYPAFLCVCAVLQAALVAWTLP